MAPASFREIQSPRDGRALNNRVCIVYSQRYQINFGGLEKLHSFDINKYAKIYAHLIADGSLRSADVFVPDEISPEDLLRVHVPAYLERLKSPSAVARYLEFPPAALLPRSVLREALVRPFRFASGGTLMAARLALVHGMAINIGGGYHHAQPDCGGGFCLYADMPVAIRALQAEGWIKRALVVDLDVHQGNGTDICLAGDDNVFTFDMHEQDIYPHPKEHSSLDVPLNRGTGDTEYLALLSRHLPNVFDRARPDLVFLQAGVDTLADDPLAHLVLTPAGIVARDALVFAQAARRRIPIVMVLGGGYSLNAWHAQYLSIRQAIQHYGRAEHAEVARRSLTVKEKLYVR